MSAWRTIHLPLCAALAAGALLTTAAAQGPGPGASRRAVVSSAYAPAIDRGLRSLDAPREPGNRTRIRRSGPSEPYVRGSVIVKFRPGTSAVARRSIAARIDGTAPAAPLPYADFEIVGIDPSADPEAAARLLEEQPDVEYAQARYRVSPRLVPNDPLYERQWNYPAIDMERAWDINPGASSAITVAVLDSGVAYFGGILRFTAFAVPLEGGEVLPELGVIDVPFAPAPDLAGPGRFVAPYDFIWNDDVPVDLDGHGTHVTGTIGQLTNNGVGGAGMAYNVRIMPIKVLAGDWDWLFGNFQEGTDDLVAQGIRYAADNGAKVINMSIGRFGGPAPVVRAAIEYAVARGAFVAVAGGNDFESGNPVERLAEFAPEIQGMVAVGAVDRNRQRAYYSNTGPYIELAAPGGDQRFGGTEAGILQQTLDPDLVATFLLGPVGYRAPRFDGFTYEFFQGTSMATPHVAGFAALLMQQGITSPAAIEAAMKRFATDLGPPGRDDAYGFGLINPRATLRGLGLTR